ncbi:MAG: prepilin peptidase [Sphingomonadales bacterium]|jgi:prepilin peptidase CpaA|nr:prepilin peptidase [Sphingomonadales bacterium]
MSITSLETACAGILALGLLIAAGTDLKARIIPNWLVLAIACGAPVWWWASGLTLWPDVAWQIGLGLAVMTVFTAIFALGQMGGGDVKLLGALALWFPPIPMLQLLVIMSMAGGVLTLFLFLLHKARKREGNPEIPYGVAISIAALWVLYERNLNQFA